MIERRLSFIIAGLTVFFMSAVLWNLFAPTTRRSRRGAPVDSTSVVVARADTAVAPGRPVPRPARTAGLDRRVGPELHGAARSLRNAAPPPRQRGLHLSQRGRGPERGFDAASLGQPHLQPGARVPRAGYGRQLSARLP